MTNITVDIQQNNYLVDIEWTGGVPRITGKITDFGLSHILHSTIGGLESANSLSSEAIRWRAPEMADIEEGSDMRDLALEKADVWSFSLTALEVRNDSLFLIPFPPILKKYAYRHTQVIQNETPFSQSIVGAQAFWKAWLRKPEILADALPKENPDKENLSQAAFEVMSQCWNLDPAKRPTMREVEDRYSALFAEE
jgi:serine/threonine protein kinase